MIHLNTFSRILYDAVRSQSPESNFQCWSPVSEISCCIHPPCSRKWERKDSKASVHYSDWKRIRARFKKEKHPERFIASSTKKGRAAFCFSKSLASGGLQGATERNGKRPKWLRNAHLVRFRAAILEGTELRQKCTPSPEKEGGRKGVWPNKSKAWDIRHEFLWRGYSSNAALFE